MFSFSFNGFKHVYYEKFWHEHAYSSNFETVLEGLIFDFAFPA